MKFTSMQWPGRLGWMCLVLLLGGCSLFREPAVTPGGALSPNSLKAWRLEGRIGVKTPAEGWTANLFWEHDGRQDRLRISGPFSQGMVSIIVQDDLIHINEGNGVEQTSRDPDTLLRERLGFAVPLRSLRYWVTGVPAPDADYVEEQDAAGAVRRFRQQGWTLAYEKFTRVGTMLLPQKASINGHDVRLKLIADDWSLEE